jgi:hypothetical protein
MGSKQASRYIKNRMGDELKNKILERHGIKIAQQPQMVSRTCGRCNYVNKLESKYCERSGCNYPMTQLALDEIKKQEESRMNSMIDERLKDKDEEIRALKTSFKSYDERVEEVAEKMEAYVKWQKKEEERRKVMYDTLDRLSPGWKEPYHATLRRPLNAETRKKLEEFLEQLENAPDSYDDD